MKEIALKSGLLGSERSRSVAAVAIAFATYVLLCIPFGHWLVDDAAISMAYAANWTAGHGLVAQPGIPPVEGYSNFLWVVVLAALNLAGLMTPLPIKAVAAVLVLGSLVSLYAASKPLIPTSWPVRAAVLLLVATNSSLVTWTTSGLENPLTLLLACELLRVATLDAWEGSSVRRAIYLGVLVAALAMTRPEGILFAPFPPLVMAMSGRWDWRTFGVYVGIVVAIASAFLAFRYATFGDWVPNTFYAKGASSLDLVLRSRNAIDLLKGPFGSAFVMVACFVVAVPQVRRGDDKRLIPPLCLMAIAGGLFVMMPPDWMPDRRFGTAFLPAVYVFVGVVASQLAAHRLRLPLIVGLVLIGTFVSIYRLVPLYRLSTQPLPIMPMSVVERVSLTFNERARLMNLTDGSVLLPDIGAALLTSKLRVYDLAGLIDPVIGRSIFWDRPRFHHYVFEEIRPTFIRTHGPWAQFAAFDEDPRFRRDYVPIAEQIDWRLLRIGVRMKSGDYVRRDALAKTGDPLMLEKLRSVAAAPGPRPPGR